MKRAMILYKSRTGITRLLAENIQKHIQELGVIPDIKPIEEFIDSDIEGIDYIFLGCWTSGLMVIFQGPERTWVEFAKRLSGARQDRACLWCEAHGQRPVS